MRYFYKQRRKQKVRQYLKYVQSQLRMDHHNGCRSHGLCLAYYYDEDVCAERWFVDGLLKPIHRELSSDIQKFSNNLSLDEILEAVQDAEWLCTMRQRDEKYFGEEVSQYNGDDFDVDQNGHIIVYTDGACPGNGQPGAQGGIGGWFGQYHHENFSIRLDSCYRQTNNVAEIRAVIEAIETVKNLGIRLIGAEFRFVMDYSVLGLLAGYSRIAIHTDSDFLCKSMTSYIFQWLSNGWLRSNGRPVVNKTDFRDLLEAMEDMDVEWVHVKAHERSGTSRHTLGNNEADRLAREGVDC